MVEFCDPVLSRVCASGRASTAGQGVLRYEADDGDCGGDHRQVPGEGVVGAPVRG